MWSLITFIMFGHMTKFAESENGCLQCTGVHSIYFGEFTSQTRAVAFVRASLDGCATGNDYEMTPKTQIDCTVSCPRSGQGCTPPGVTVCKSWEFDLTVWRYCGRSSLINRDKSHRSPGGVYAPSDTMRLNCDRWVDCKSACSCDYCGC